MNKTQVKNVVYIAETSKKKKNNRQREREKKSSFSSNLECTSSKSAKRTKEKKPS